MPAIGFARASPQGRELADGYCLLQRPAATAQAAREFRTDDRITLRACYSNPKFALVGFEGQTNSFGNLVNLVPVYRCYGDGMHFDYLASSWQSGGSFAIVRHAYREQVAA